MNFIRFMKTEFQIIKDRDPAIHTPLEVFLYPSFRAILYYRVAHKLYLKKHYFVARWISQRAARKTGIEIHPGAKIGKGLFIDHGHGVIIGETAVVGDNVTLYQGVTLGGVGTKKGKRHPTMGNNVLIGAGAKILGAFEVGDNCQIAANAVLLKPLEENSTAAGIPARQVKKDGLPVKDPAKKVNMGHICKIQDTIDELERRVRELEKELEEAKKEL